MQLSLQRARAALGPRGPPAALVATRGKSTTIAVAFETIDPPHQRLAVIHRLGHILIFPSFTAQHDSFPSRAQAGKFPRGVAQREVPGNGNLKGEL